MSDNGEWSRSSRGAGSEWRRFTQLSPQHVHISDNKSLVTTMATLSSHPPPTPPNTLLMPIRARWEDSLQLLRSSMCFSQRGKINSSSSSASSSSLFLRQGAACSLSFFLSLPIWKNIREWEPLLRGSSLYTISSAFKSSDKCECGCLSRELAK